MPNYATATIIGHLGRDPEVRYTADGGAVVGFSMATSRKRKDEETTTWWRVSMFGKRGETLAKYLTKGDPVLVTGEPFLRDWTDKEGNARQSLELVANDFAFLGRSEGSHVAEAGQRSAQVTGKPSRAAQEASGAFQGGGHGGGGGGQPFEDDIPFDLCMRGSVA